MENKNQNNELSIFAEILPNVKSMTVNVGLPNKKDESSYKFGIYPLKLIFESQPPPNKATLPIKIEVPLVQTIETSEQPIVTNSEESIDIKLKLRTFVRKRPAKRDISTSETYQSPFSSTEISSLKNILCGMCKERCIKENTLNKILDMPSEHWLELIDCWMCHQENYKHAIIGDIVAKENVGLVGNTYFLMHPNNVRENVLRVDVEESQEIDIIMDLKKANIMKLDNLVDTTSPKLNHAHLFQHWAKGMSKKWISMNCSRCLASIGEGLYCKSNEELILLAVRFSKYMTLIELGGSEDVNVKESIIRKYKFTAFFAGDFLEAAKAHATYRFIIKGKRFRRPYILIWLFGWDSKIMMNALEGSKPFRPFSKNVEEDCSIIESNLKICDVMKILYVDCTTIEQDVTSTRLMEQWQKDKTVEHFIYQDDICLELLLLLRKSTSCLPFSKRHMNDFLVGFMDMNG
ncbi:13888_t:CDS:2 [Funneliformis geosporum]|uniref:13888_t:CDS:1 n=1 Tax=Funneliformis geosporum TaxID=1117311 RepID=A0A9W4SJU6_9GLOM|nr:13888_t:CDS:2 [Funneliformis geosporum]